MTEYTRELSKDILERLQTQRLVGNQTGASQADVSITEALTLLAEIERLRWEQEIIFQTVDSADGSLGEQIRKESAERWKEANEADLS